MRIHEKNAHAPPGNSLQPSADQSCFDHVGINHAHLGTFLAFTLSQFGFRLFYYHCYDEHRSDGYYSLSIFSMTNSSSYSSIVSIY